LVIPNSGIKGPKPTAPPKEDFNEVYNVPPTDTPRNYTSAPSAPRQQSVANLHLLWRTSYSKLPEINAPPSPVNNNNASAPLVRSEQSMINLLKGQKINDDFLGEGIPIAPRSVPRVVPRSVPRTIKKPIKPKTYKCPTCGNNFNDRENLKTHLDLHQQQKIQKKKQIYKCHKCQRTYRSNYDLQRHYNNRYACDREPRKVSRRRKSSRKASRKRSKRRSRKVSRRRKSSRKSSRKRSKRRSRKVSRRRSRKSSRKRKSSTKVRSNNYSGRGGFPV